MDVKKLFPIVGITILIYILYTTDIGEIVAVFSKINPLYSFLSILSIIPVLFLLIIQWQCVLKKQKIHVSKIYSVKNMLIGYFYGFISPGGLGAYTRALYLQSESKEPLPKCLSNIIIFNAIDILTLLFIGAIGGLILSSIFPHLFFITILLLVAVLSLFIFFIKKDTSKNFFKRLIEKQIFSSFKDKLNEPIDAFYQDLPGFKDLILPFIISVVNWIVFFIELYFIAKLFNIDVPFVSFMLIYAIANVIAILPITIYGLGTRDATLIGLFYTLFEIEPSRVIAFSLFMFVIIWLIPSIIGAIVTVYETKNVDFDFSLQKKN